MVEYKYIKIHEGGSMRKKQDSIKRRLCRIAVLQCTLVIFFWLYMTISEATILIRETASEIYQSEEKVLTELENQISTLARVTLFPTNQALFANNDTLYTHLRDGSVQNDFAFGSEFFDQALTQLKNEAVDFVALYDVEGNGVYLSKTDDIYYECTIRQDAAWYREVLSGPKGKVSVLNQETFVGSGIVEKDRRSICAARNLVDSTTYKTIGVCVAGSNVDRIVNATALGSDEMEQEYAVFYQEQLLFGNTEKLILKEYSQKPIQKIYWNLQELSLEYSMFHEDNLAIIVQIPFFSIFHYMMPLQIFGIILLVLILILITLIIFKIIASIKNPLNQLVKACNTFESSYVPTLPDIELPKEFREVFLSFNSMSDKINTVIHEVLMKDLEKRKLELQLLRTQINPHYLYNTLEMMHMTAYTNGDFGVAEMAELLGRNLQYGLRETTKEVSLKEELEQLDVYLKIIFYRFKDSVTVHKMIDPELLRYKTIKLLFQPMIENSVFHGIKSSEQHLTIDILGYKQENKIVL